MRGPSAPWIVAGVALLAAGVGGAGAAGGLVGSDDVRNGSLRGVDVRDGSLTGADVRNSSLRGVDVRNGSLTGADIRDRSIRAREFHPSALAAVAGIAGAQGPAGPTGPQGPAGPAGPQGPSGTIATGDITRRGDSGSAQDIPPGGIFTVSSACAPGEVVLAGGYNLTSANTAFTVSVSTWSPGKWSVTVRNGSSAAEDTGLIVTYANCLAQEAG